MGIKLTIISKLLNFDFLIVDDVHHTWYAMLCILQWPNSHWIFIFRLCFRFRFRLGFRFRFCSSYCKIAFWYITSRFQGGQEGSCPQNCKRTDWLSNNYLRVLDLRHPKLFELPLNFSLAASPNIVSILSLRWSEISPLYPTIKKFIKLIG